MHTESVPETNHIDTAATTRVGDTLAPDWVCEVLSPSTRRLNLLEKRPTYAREGVGHLWLIDPTDRTLEAFELHEGQWLLVTDGASSPDRQRWVTPARRGFLFPTAALSKVFRGKYLDSLATAHRSGELRMPGPEGLDDTRAFESMKTSLQSNDWVVYTKAPFAGAAHVLAYLGRYTHKTAFANHRLVDFDAEQVRFRWRDYAHANKLEVMRLDTGEFIRRFLLHVLPRGFTRLRHYGLLANRGRARNLALCRTLLAQPAPEPREPQSPQAMMLRLTGIDISVCRRCGRGPLRQTLILAPQFHALVPVPTARPP